MDPFPFAYGILFSIKNEIVLSLGNVGLPGAYILKEMIQVDVDTQYVTLVMYAAHKLNSQM